MSEAFKQCKGYKCNCSDYRFGHHESNWHICNCGHSREAHIRVRNQDGSLKMEPDPYGPTTGLEGSEPISEGQVAAKSTRAYKAPSEPYQGTLTAGEARAILRAHGVEVGTRGRMSPEQFAKAEELRRNDTSTN